MIRFLALLRGLASAWRHCHPAVLRVGIAVWVLRLVVLMPTCLAADPRTASQDLRDEDDVHMSGDASDLRGRETTRFVVTVPRHESDADFRALQCTTGQRGKITRQIDTDASGRRETLIVATDGTGTVALQEWFRSQVANRRLPIDAGAGRSTDPTVLGPPES